VSFCPLLPVSAYCRQSDLTKKATELNTELFENALQLPAWTEQGLINQYRIGGRVFYLFSEIVEKAKTLKKYKV
jgi:hypothetical protein